MFKGIDVSYAQGVIDWVKVKNQIDFAIIRAGYGQGNIDKQAARNISECNRIGIPCGAYWFSYAFNTEMVKNEAKYILNFIKNYRIDYPIFYDFEYDSVTYAKNNGVSTTKNLLSDFITTFCESIENGGYYAGVYANQDYLSNMINPAIISRFDLWYARYSKTCDRTVNLWQYSDSLQIDGIYGNVDGDISNVDFPARIKTAGLKNLKEVSTMTKDEAKQIVKDKTGFSDQTIQYIADDYRYGDELITKLATVLKGGN